MDLISEFLGVRELSEIEKDVEVQSLVKYEAYRINADASGKEVMERHSRYYETHREEIKEYHRRYYEEHKIEVLEAHRRYNEANREKVREYGRRYREEHAEELRAYWKLKRMLRRVRQVSS